MSGDTLFILLGINLVLLGGVLYALFSIYVVLMKASNEMITALQAIYDDLRRGKSS